MGGGAGGIFRRGTGLSLLLNPRTIRHTES